MTINAPKRRLRAWLAASSAALALGVLASCAGAGGQSSEPAAIASAAAARPMDAAQWPQGAVADPALLGFTAEGLAALEARLARSVAEQDVAGVTVLLARKGDVAMFKSYGKQSETAPMSNDTMFRIYSMTKPVTGVAMMQLYEQGKWNLDDPITLHAPELADLKIYKGLDAKGAPILGTPSRPPTMRELMSHTAGFGYGLNGDDPVNTAFREQAVLASANLDEMMAKVANIPLLLEPGERWYYSAAVDIQGYLVQKMSGQKFGDYLKANIFAPLAMSDTAFFVAPEKVARFADVYRWDKDLGRLAVNPERPDRPRFTDPRRMESGGGGLVSTTHDYARFCQMLLNGGELAGKRLLKPATVALMAQNHIGELRLYSDGTTANPGLPGVSFGLDFAVYGDSAATGLPYGKGSYWWGGAAGTWFWIDPKNDLFFIGMIQRQGGTRPGSMDFRNDSARLVYAALAQPAAAAAPAK